MIEMSRLALFIMIAAATPAFAKPVGSTARGPVNAPMEGTASGSSMSPALPSGSGSSGPAGAPRADSVPYELFERADTVAGGTLSIIPSGLPGSLGRPWDGG